VKLPEKNPKFLEIFQKSIFFKKLPKKSKFFAKFAFKN